MKINTCTTGSTLHVDRGCTPLKEPPTHDCGPDIPIIVDGAELCKDRIDSDVDPKQKPCPYEGYCPPCPEGVEGNWCQDDDERDDTDDCLNGEGEEGYPRCSDEDKDKDEEELCGFICQEDKLREDMENSNSGSGSDDEISEMDVDPEVPESVEEDSSSEEGSESGGSPPSDGEGSESGGSSQFG